MKINDLIKVLTNREKEYGDIEVSIRVNRDWQPTIPLEEGDIIYETFQAEEIEEHLVLGRCYY